MNDRWKKDYYRMTGEKYKKWIKYIDKFNEDFSHSK